MNDDKEEPLARFVLNLGGRSPWRRIARAARHGALALTALALALYAGWRLGTDHGGGDPNRLYTPGEPAFHALTTDARIVALIKDHEKLRLSAYKGAGGNWLIGYGHKASAKPGARITEAEAEALFEADLREIERLLKRRIARPIRRREFSAMVDLAYNVGPTAAGRSSVVRLFNAGDRDGAADALLLWNKITVNGRKVSNRNLSLRRARARAHFLGEAFPTSDTQVAQQSDR